MYAEWEQYDPSIKQDKNSFNNPTWHDSLIVLWDQGWGALLLEQSEFELQIQTH